VATASMSDPLATMTFAGLEVPILHRSPFGGFWRSSTAQSLPSKRYHRSSHGAGCGPHGASAPWGWESVRRNVHLNDQAVADRVDVANHSVIK
jgi:hypothetical protein